MCINIKTVAYQIENFANKIPKLTKGVVNDRLRATPQGDTTGRLVCCLVWFKYVTKRETNSLYMSSSVRTGQGHDFIQSQQIYIIVLYSY